MDFFDTRLFLHSAIGIHCAATRPSMDIGFKEIDAWHKERKFRMCGYHLIIRRDGTYEMGRPWDQQGAHASGWNRNPADGKLTFGICLVGGVREDNVNIPEDNFTVEQYQSLNRALGDIMKYTGITEIKGHNELPGHESRGCPSFDIQSYRTWLLEVHESLYHPDDWWKENWKDGAPDEWNEVALHKEINVDSGGLE